MLANAQFQPHTFTYDVRSAAPSTELLVKKKFLYGDRSASSRIRRSKNTAQATVWKTYPVGFFQKNAVERNTVIEAVARVRAGGATVPPKVTGKRPPVPAPTYNVPWTAITTDIMGFDFNGVVIEMEASETGQYQSMVLYTYYNAILPQYVSSVYVSADYGRSWTQTIQENTDGYGRTGYSFYSISRNGQYHAFITLSNPDSGETGPNAYSVMISADYGNTWTKHRMDANTDMPAVCISNDGQTVIVGHSISFDGGVTFTNTDIFTDIEGFAGTYSASMSTDAQYISIAMVTDIWVSSDGGHTFSPTLSILQPDVGDGSFSGSVNMTPDGRHQYVSKFDLATDTTILYVSDDYGATWTAVVPRLVAGSTTSSAAGSPGAVEGQILPSAFWNRRSISPNGQEQVVSILVFNTVSPDDDLVQTYYSSDGGATWMWLDKTIPSAEGLSFTPLWTEKGLVSYGNTPTEPFQGKVYVSPTLTGSAPPAPTKGGIDQHPWRAITKDITGTTIKGTYIVELASSATGQYITILSDYFVYVSHDYGRTWTQTDSKVRAAGYMSDMFSYMAVSRNGQHQAIMEWTPESTGTNRVHLSNDYGMTWQIKPLPDVVHPSVCVSDDGNIIYFGNYKSIDAADRFIPIQFLDMPFVPSGVDPATILTTANAVSFDGISVTLTDHTTGRIYVSNDSGATFQVVTTYIDGITGQTRAIPGRFTGSVCMSYNGEYQYVTCFYPSTFLQSSDYGFTWTSVDVRDEDTGAPLPQDYYWTKRTMDPSTRNQIICNTNAFHAYVSTDGGVHWKQLTNAYNTLGEVNSLTPIMSTQTVLNTWKNQIYIYP